MKMKINIIFQTKVSTMLLLVLLLPLACLSSRSPVLGRLYQSEGGAAAAPHLEYGYCEGTAARAGRLQIRLQPLPIGQHSHYVFISDPPLCFTLAHLALVDRLTI